MIKSKKYWNNTRSTNGNCLNIAENCFEQRFQRTICNNIEISFFGINYDKKIKERSTLVNHRLLDKRPIDEQFLQHDATGI